MPAEKGRAFVLKVGDGATSEEFTTVGGMRVTALDINGERVDITDKDDAGWRTLLADAGIKSVSITGSGVFKDSVSEATVRTNVLAQTIDNYELVFENGDKFTGAFQVNMGYSGSHDGEVTYSLTLDSSGEVSFEPSA